MSEQFPTPAQANEKDLETIREPRMSNNRGLRLLGTIATLAGAIGLTLVWTTDILQFEGNIVFPIALGVGIATLYVHRPKKRRKTFHQ